MGSVIQKRMAEKLRFLYENDNALTALLEVIAAHPIPAREAALDESEMLLIAYGDHVQGEGRAHLETLRDFAREHLHQMVSGIHILPFYPYTSDDGFSVVDYLTVDPALGDWDDVKRLGHDFRLMFDLVLNHVSASSAWFQGFLRDETPYRDYIMTATPEDDLSTVTRPRTHPLLTPFETTSGTRHVWTTFSTDQVDLNYSNPDVLLEIVRTLLFYVQQGADYIRMDAIAYLWKIPGTTCIHLPKTHTVVQLFRDVLDMAAPWVKIITETNVPHEENISYFGDGHNEAQLVYQFALPPLLLHTLNTENAEALSSWAATLETPSESTTFFNFTASHDGVGVRPLAGLVPDEALNQLIEAVMARGGDVSYKANSDGTRSPYELNITYFDALAVPGEALDISVDRFICSQAIMLALAGVPGIYLPSLFGAANWHEGVRETGRARTINREKFEVNTLKNMVDDPNTRYGKVFRRYRELLRVRRSQAAFHPGVSQKVLDMDTGVFALERDELLAIHNVSSAKVTVDLGQGLWHDLITETDHRQNIGLRPYQFAWLIPG